MAPRATKETNIMTQLIPNANWQTPQRGENCDEFQIFLACADDGKGGDITNHGEPLPTFDEWMER